MFIPWQRLSPEALQNLVDDYCTRSHGLCADDDFESLLERRQQVMQALRAGLLVIRWSESESAAWIINPAAGSR